MFHLTESILGGKPITEAMIRRAELDQQIIANRGGLILPDWLQQISEENDARRLSTQSGPHHQKGSSRQSRPALGDDTV